MILYHGTTIEITEPKILRSEIYDFDDESACSALRSKSYPDVSMEWLEMVVQCRGNSDYQHGYDIVEGKIANDNVGETVSYVMQGIMRKEDAVERLRFEKINNQIAFCSERAIAGLNFLRSYEVEG